MVENNLLETGGRLLPTPNAYDSQKGGSQHPDKRRAGGHSVSVADVIEQELLPTPKAGDADFGLPRTSGRPPEKSTHLATRLHFTDFGRYAEAVSRWEQVLGRPAPAPTELSPKGRQRLSARFVEWMMGQPEGRVTDPELGLSRVQQIKALGNGVVTQQALLALGQMFNRLPSTMIDSESRDEVVSETQQIRDRKSAMRITIDTFEPLSPTEIEILEVLIGRKREQAEPTAAPAKKAPAKKAPAKPKPKAEPTPDEEPDEFASDEAVKETKTPAKAKKADPEPEAEESRSLEDLLTEASELATEIMNQGGKAKIKDALKTVGAPKVSAIDDAGQAAKFLAALKAED